MNGDWLVAASHRRGPRVLDRAPHLSRRRRVEGHVTPQEALDRIAALCDRHAPAPAGACQVADEVRAVLAEVSPEPGGVLDRDRAREVIETALRWKDHPDPPSMDVYLDRLAGGVRPAAIDRDALMDLLIRYDVEHPATLGEAADVRAIYVNRILALVRPVEAAS